MQFYSDEIAKCIEYERSAYLHEVGCGKKMGMKLGRRIEEKNERILRKKP
jgi:hypothetical protein